MDRTIISRIEAWDSRSASGGYVGLNALADDDFTGAVTAGGTHLFMLNGRVVGVFDGDISAFEGADVEAYAAPDPALPLLFSMQAQGGEVRGKYYTDDTPIGEVDDTLTSSGFTGYLELSENVLSGDYYVVYYGGRSLSAAFVGNEGRTVTGDEAFDLAADEVGIYEVTAVDLEVTDVPEPSEDATAAAGAGGATAAAAKDVEEAADVDEETPEAADTEAEDEDTEAEEDVEVDDAAEPTAVEDDADGEDVEDESEAEDASADESAGDESATDDDAAEAQAESAAEASDGRDEAPPDETPGPDGPEDDDAAASVAESAGEEPIREAEPEGGSVATNAAADSPGAGSTDRPAPESSGGRPAQREAPARGEPDERFEEEARWRETATVPALDPEESAPPEADPEPVGEPREEPVTEAEPQRTEPGTTAEAGALRERIGRLETELEETERERRRLDERLETVRSEKEELAEERDALEARIEELEARVEEAEAAAEAAAASAGSAAGSASTTTSTGGRSVDPETALDQTDLFVRYGSKADPTLGTAHDGQASAEEVAENLRIETHSRFDTDTATVDGRPFNDYLEGTIQYRFVSWLVEELLYEIQETGTESGLRELYDVLPELDRAEFDGTVTSYDEEGDASSESFDVVCRDRMGKPLVVANINDSLDPATGDMMATLVEDATEAAEAHESMGAAFLVTASFFQPDALETAAEATRGGGFLSRDSKKSFVKLARNGGYHLCLVEARGDDFHVAVPEI